METAQLLNTRSYIYSTTKLALKRLQHSQGDWILSYPDPRARVRVALVNYYSLSHTRADDIFVIERGLGRLEARNPREFSTRRNPAFHNDSPAI